MTVTIHAIKAGIALVLALVLTACVTTLGRDFNEEYARSIKSGETTKTEVLGKLGAPSLRKGGKDEETWTYAYYTGPGVFGWMNIAFSSSDEAQYGLGKQKRLVVMFAGDVVKAATFTQEIPEPH